MTSKYREIGSSEQIAGIITREDQEETPCRRCKFRRCRCIAYQAHCPCDRLERRFSGNIWHVKILPDIANGLTKCSAIDTLQIRGVDVQRFIRKLGWLPSPTMEEISAAIVAIIEYS